MAASRLLITLAEQHSVLLHGDLANALPDLHLLQFSCIRLHTPIIYVLGIDKYLLMLYNAV